MIKFISHKETLKIKEFKYLIICNKKIYMKIKLMIKQKSLLRSNRLKAQNASYI